MVARLPPQFLYLAVLGFADADAAGGGSRPVLNVACKYL
jgi:hypothetical protein